MSDSSGTGFIALDSNMYFTCSSGITPAQMYPHQAIAKTGEKHYYLIVHDTATQSKIDFTCRWTTVLAVAVAAICVLSGGTALVVIIGAIAAAAVAGLMMGMGLCGGLMAPGRKWVGYSKLNEYGVKGAFSLTSKCQMVCPIGGVITYAPGITSTWQAAVYSARNWGMAVLEGVIWGAIVNVGGTVIMTGLKSVVTMQTIGNIVFVSTIGATDQVIFEGLLREGKRNPLDLLKNAGQGATWMVQPFITLAERGTSGYYNGGYATDADGKDITEAHNWHGAGALATDTYNAVLTVASLGLLGKQSMDGTSYRKESIAAAKKMVEAAKALGGKLFEIGKTLLPEEPVQPEKLTTPEEPTPPEESVPPPRNFNQEAADLDKNGGHSYADHGAHTTEGQHKQRLMTGETPGGSQRPIPEASGKFNSDQEHIAAYEDSQARLQTEKYNSKGGLKKKVEIKNVPFEGGTSYTLDANGNLVYTPTKYYTAIYKLNPVTGNYDLITLYPNN